MNDFTGLFIATPAYLGNVHADHAGSLLRTFRHLWAGKIRSQSKFFTGASAVQIARGVLAAQFMASGYSHLLFIDADLGWEPEAVGRLLAASEHHDVCCGVYRKKCDPLAFPVNFELTDDRQPVIHAATGYLELRDACCGFMMVRRRALERMIAAYPERKCSFREEAGTPETEGKYEYNLFDFSIDDDPRRMYLSEDFGFTRRYQAIGGHVWADPDIRLAHHGHKRYEGCIRDVMEEQGAESPATFADVLPLIVKRGAPEALAVDEAEALWGAADGLPAGAHIVEIGCERGRSSVLFACAAKKHGHRLSFVDPWIGWNGEATHQQVTEQAAFWMAGMRDVGHPFTLHCMKSGEAPIAERIDLLYIDGLHETAAIEIDCRYADRVPPGGLVAVHDYGRFPDVAAVAEQHFGAWDSVSLTNTLKIYRRAA